MYCHSSAKPQWQRCSPLMLASFALGLARWNRHPSARATRKESFALVVWEVDDDNIWQRCIAKATRKSDRRFDIIDTVRIRRRIQDSDNCTTRSVHDAQGNHVHIPKVILCIHDRCAYRQVCTLLQLLEVITCLPAGSAV